MKTLLFILALGVSAMADSDTEKILRQGNDQFTTRMFSEVIKSKPKESVVISAFSVLSPLAQLALASVGETHDETLRTIGFPNDNVTKEVFTDVNKRLRSVSGIDLKLASRIYVKTGAELNDDFAVVSRDTFGSDVKNADFTKAQETAKEINAWVEDNTNNRIKDLVDPNSLGPDTEAVLVNAIYFKGSWKNRFNKEATSERDFHVSKDKTIKVSMMYQSQDFKYGESKELDAKLLEMPYEGEKSSLLIVLPNEVDGIQSMLEKLNDPTVLAKAVENMYTFEVEVFLPKFKIETTTDLKDVLQKMGCKRLFNPVEAKLDNLIKGQSDLSVSEAIQKAFIEVNEEGAEAAAANQFTVVLTALPPEYKRVFVADRPFYFALKVHDLSVFTGKYVQ